MNPKGLATARRVPSAAVWITALALALTALGTAWAADDVSRIREKCEEMYSKVLEEQYSSAGEGKESNLTRVYKDFDYLLKASKTDKLQEGIEKAPSPEEAAHIQKSYDFLMLQRVYGQIAPSMDNMLNYERNGSISIAGSSTALTMRTFPVMVATEENRSNRRNWYLASRELLENANVFLLNLKLDFDKFSRELAGHPGAEHKAEIYGYDLDLMNQIADVVLESTRDEYEALLTDLAASQLDGMELKDLRAYDAPYLLRFPALDKSFPSGKMEDVSKKWLKSLGIDLGGQRYLRFNLDDLEGKDPEPQTFPIQNERNTRISMVPLGGLPDYLDFLTQLGQAEFRYHIDPQLVFENRYLGSPLLDRTYGMLFRSVIFQPGWREAYLKVRGEDAELTGKALRLIMLHDLRNAAGRHKWQVIRHADPEVSITKYTEIMQDALLWNHGGSEMSGYLLADDDYESGLFLVASVLAAQLEDKLAGEFGPEWYSDPKAGAWLRGEWFKGFTVSGPELPQSWGLSGADPSALLALEAGEEPAGENPMAVGEGESNPPETAPEGSSAPEAGAEGLN